MKYVKTTAALFVISIVMAIILAGINQIVAPIIAENKANALDSSLSGMYDNVDHTGDTVNIDYETTDGKTNVIEKYTLYDNEDVIVAIVYKVEGMNTFSGGTPTVMLVGFNIEGVITNIELVNIKQTKSGMEGFGPGEYEDKPVSYEYTIGDTDTYSGVTVGTRMLNEMIKAAKFIDAGGNEE